jgi:primosomal protein N' (replication factor Y)
MTTTMPELEPAPLTPPAAPARFGRIAAVAFPIAVRGVYDYGVPQEFIGRLSEGMPVQVDLKGRTLWGVVVGEKAESEYGSLKPILGIRSEGWTDRSSALITLYRWIATYYQCDLGRVFRPLVGKGISSATAKTVVVYVAVAGNGPMTALSAMQKAAFESISGAAEPLTRKELEEKLGVSPSVLSALCRKKVVKAEKKTVAREEYFGAAPVAAPAVTLTGEQQAAVDAILAHQGVPDKPFLLHGITGSGKTHIYTELAARTLERGRSVIILVPEISLTPQTIMRFREAVGDVVTVIHSRMSDGERRDSMQALVTGAKRLVIGVRSAVLAPCDNVGLIIVDEEHDGSYKQTDTEPRYHARDVAIMRGVFERALVVLGSATPSLESYYNAQSGKYRLLTLASRFGEARLPAVTVADMNEERTSGNWTILSRRLEASMLAALAAGRQIILLLNRRGYSAVLLCKECGFTHRCTACSLPLRYHRSGYVLKCHCCGHEEAAPDRCPLCHGEVMKYQGVGIQKAEELLKEKFPDARILRMDHDTTQGKRSHHDILDAFAKREADILLGTQMVAKGLDFPGVALVGVLQADLGLLFPDFRASERTFQLLTQVAGRAGRSDGVGEVVIQTSYPDDPAIATSAKHDYECFYATELPNRKELRYPPFAKLARIVVAGPAIGPVEAEITKIAAGIRNSTQSITLLGPAPAVLEKMGNEFRYSLLLKSGSPKLLSGVLSSIRESHRKANSKVKLIVDVDPVYMM